MQPAHDTLSVRRQCELLGLCRGSYYYAPAEESSEDLAPMRRIDALHLEHPYYGSRQTALALRREGESVNRKRVQRLMRVEQLWRSLKYEDVYLKAYGDVQQAREGIGRWFRFYNERRPHQAFGGATPREVYRGQVSRRGITSSARSPSCMECALGLTTTSRTRRTPAPPRSWNSGAPSKDWSGKLAAR